MAIVILGKTECRICGEVIKSKQDHIAFPNFVMNELDPLYIFHDAAFHNVCFYNHPLSGKAVERMKDIQEKTWPKERRCWICKREIMDLDNYLGFGFLSDNPEHSIFPYNYAQYHKSCLRGFKDLSSIISEMENFENSGCWKGKAISWLINELRKLS